MINKIWRDSADFTNIDYKDGIILLYTIVIYKTMIDIFWIVYIKFGKILVKILIWDFSSKTLEVFYKPYYNILERCDYNLLHWI